MMGNTRFIEGLEGKPRDAYERYDNPSVGNLDGLISLSKMS